MRIDSERFKARLRADLAPESCRYLLQMLPYSRKLVHARWSGEAMWSPLGEASPRGALLHPENARHQPRPGEVLLYAGTLSEPELLIPYGASRFACKDGPLEGNPVMTIEDGVGRLAEIGSQVLWKGAKELRIEVSP